MAVCILDYVDVIFYLYNVFKLKFGLEDMVRIRELNNFTMQKKMMIHSVYFRIRDTLRTADLIMRLKFKHTTPNNNNTLVAPNGQSNLPDPKHTQTKR